MIEAVQSPFPRQPTGDADRGVSGEGADLHGELRAHGGNGGGEPGALIAGDLHPRGVAGLGGGALGELAEQGVAGVVPMGIDVGGELVVERNILEHLRIREGRAALKSR